MLHSCSSRVSTLFMLCCNLAVFTYEGVLVHLHFDSKASTPSVWRHPMLQLCKLTQAVLLSVDLQGHDVWISSAALRGIGLILNAFARHHLTDISW
jgi:hypothetical protein